MPLNRGGRVVLTRPSSAERLLREPPRTAGVQDKDDPSQGRAVRAVDLAAFRLSGSFVPVAGWSVVEFIGGGGTRPQMPLCLRPITEE